MSDKPAFKVGATPEERARQLAETFKDIATCVEVERLLERMPNEDMAALLIEYVWIDYAITSPASSLLSIVADRLQQKKAIDMDMKNFDHLVATAKLVLKDTTDDNARELAGIFLAYAEGRAP
jgi:hypothetical protein